MSYGFDSMDEVAHQLATAYGSEGRSTVVLVIRHVCICAHAFLLPLISSVYTSSQLISGNGSVPGDSRPTGHVVSRQGCHPRPRSLPQRQFIIQTSQRVCPAYLSDHLLRRPLSYDFSRSRRSLATATGSHIRRPRRTRSRSFALPSRSASPSSAAIERRWASARQTGRHTSSRSSTSSP